jgi:hypothetical protein
VNTPACAIRPPRRGLRGESRAPLLWASYRLSKSAIPAGSPTDFSCIVSVLSTVWLRQTTELVLAPNTAAVLAALRALPQPNAGAEQQRG